MNELVSRQWEFLQTRAVKWKWRQVADTGSCSANHLSSRSSRSAYATPSVTASRLTTTC